MISPLISVQKKAEMTASGDDLWQTAKLFIQLGKFNQSLTIAYTATQNDPTQKKLYRQHYLETMRLGAEFAEEISDYQRAAYYWEQVTQQSSQDVTAWHGLGIAKANLQDYCGAEMALHRALQITPGNQKIKQHLIEIQQLLAAR
ncbi:hypothetical protein [Nostoc sp.]|uniref:hypothetical protein n=1 Tax=Nostoc sp. TaxID=1180 RepID=UPI002FF86158